LKHFSIVLIFLLITVFLNAQDISIYPNLGHQGEITAFAYNPEQNVLASVSITEPFIKIWGVDNARELRTISTQAAQAYSLIWNKDYTVLVYGTWAGEIVFVNYYNGEEMHRISAHRGSVNSLSISPDGKSILSASFDASVKIWDFETGREISTFEGFGASVNQAVYAAGGTVIAACSDGTVRKFDAVSGRELLSIAAHNGPVHSAVCNGDASVIATGGFDGLVKIWKSGSLIQTINAHDGPVTSLALSPDQTRVSSGSTDRTVKEWNIANGTMLNVFSGHERIVSGVKYKNNNRVFSSSFDNTIREWDTLSGDQALVFTGYSVPVSALALSSDGNFIISGHGNNVSNIDSVIRIWDTCNGALLHTLEGHSKRIWSIDISGDGTRIATGSADCTVRIWDRENNSVVFVLEGHLTDVIAVSFSPDSKKLASGSFDNTVKVWDLETGLITREYSVEGISGVKWSPNGRQLAASAGRNVYLWDLEDSSGAQTIENDRWGIMKIAYNPDGSRLAAGDWNNTITIWDTEDGGRLFSIDEDASFNTPVDAIHFSPDGKYLVSSSGYMFGGRIDNSIKIWDAETGGFLAQLEGHDSVTNALVFNNEGNRVFSASSDSTVRVWDLDINEASGDIRGVETLKMIGFTNGEWISITPDGYYYASPSGDKRLNVRVENEAFGIDQYAQTFYNPQIVEARLQRRTDPVQVKETIQNAASFEPPRVVISNPVDRADLTSSMVELSVTVVDQKQPISNIEVVVNGSLVGRDGMRGVSAGDRAVSRASPTLNVSGTENRVSFRFSVDLKEGRNIIEVIASNGKSDGMDRIEVNCLAASRRLPDLWILSIGVNGYDDNENLSSLNYAVNDAKAIIDAFKNQEGKLYGKVNSLLIADGAEITPTTDNIRDRFGYFRQAGEQDVVLLFMAGHGMNDAGNFYFMPADAAFGNDGSIRPSRAISYRDIQSVLDRPGQKLVFIDACHSEGTASRMTRGTDNVSLTNQLKNNSTFVFTSSKGNETSKELDELGHGAFTYAILEGLKGEAYPDNDMITMLGLYLYVKRTVPQLTRSLQNPIGYMPDGLEDFPLVDLR